MKNLHGNILYTEMSDSIKRYTNILENINIPFMFDI